MSLACLFWAVYTGTRPGLPPPSGRGRGGGDAGSLLPGVLPLELVACVGAYRQRHVSYITSAPPPPPPTTTPPAGVSLESCRFPCDPFRETQAVAMSDGGRAGTSSAAKRRRERRLRAAWRHEQRSVRIALAAAQHHSAPRSAGPETHNAPRGQTTARAAAGPQYFTFGDDEERAAGTHSGVMAEPAVQGRLVASCLSPGGAPSLAFPSLAAPDRDAVDGATLHFLVNAAVRLQAELDRRKKKEEEEEEEKAKQEEHEKLTLGVPDRLRHHLPVTEAGREASGVH